MQPGRVEIRLIVIGLALAVAPMRAWAVRKEPAHVQASLIIETTSIQPGRPCQAALRLTMDPGWHTYWLNPGDAGLPTTMKWRLPEGFRAEAFQWPYPMKIALPEVVSYGYADEVFLLSRIEVPSSVTPGQTLTLGGRAEWLECGELCVKGAADVSAEIPVSEELPQPDPMWVDAFATTRAKLPRPLQGWSARAINRNQAILVELTPMEPSQAIPEAMMCFPEEQGLIDHAMPQQLTRTGDRLTLELVKSRYLTAQPSRLRGVLVVQNGSGAAGPDAAYQLDVPVEAR